VKLQINEEFFKENNLSDMGLSVKGVMITPSIGKKGYWLFRVQLSEDQAIIGFPKFGTINIGFEVEDYDWNVNFNYIENSKKIYDHIKNNKGDESIDADRCIKAIEIIQKAAADFKERLSQDEKH